MLILTSTTMFIQHVQKHTNIKPTNPISRSSYQRPRISFGLNENIFDDVTESFTVDKMKEWSLLTQKQRRVGTVVNLYIIKREV